MSIRVRFAPSPSGHLHIGGARTALFNWLFARKNEGTFILRLEDSDLSRSDAKMVTGILEGLRWLGLNWDEGPYYQSQRRPLYQSIANRLSQQGQAYPCFCTPQLLNKKKRDTGKTGRAWSYEGTCRDLAHSQVQSFLRHDKPFALRFRTPDRLRICFHDQVYGPIEVKSENLEDFVIQRSDGSPTYHLCVVADDIDMGVTHVIRGVDHLSNTSKHVLLYRALEHSIPSYAHLPLILGPDRKRLSKRHGATSILNYRERGFLPAALMNYLALLGWSPGEKEELFRQDDLTDLFTLERTHKANAVFDPQKLEWMNAHYLTSLSSIELEVAAKPILQKARIWDPAWERKGRAELWAALDLLKSRARRLTDFVDLGRPFFTDDFPDDPAAVEKYFHCDEPDRTRLAQALKDLGKAYNYPTPFTLDTTEQILREIAEQHSLKAGVLIGAARVALTGKGTAPGIFDVMVTLGRERTLRRLDRGRRLLK